MIGLDPNTWLVYEGVSNYGHGVWPSPFISKATLIGTDDDWKLVPASPFMNEARQVFREQPKGSGLAI
jgi:hypothetical protein